MKQETLKEKLEKEKEKLNKLVSEALNKGTPSQKMRQLLNRTARLTHW
jgi:hypothetical protein